MRMNLVLDYQDIQREYSFWVHAATKKQDELEHFSFHALILRKNRLYNMLTDEEREYINKEEEEAFAIQMYLLEYASGEI